MRLIPIRMYRTLCQSLIASLFGTVFLSSYLVAEVALLTGNSSNQIHGGGGEIMDIAGNGDLVLFKTGPGSPTSPGLLFTGLYLRRISTGLLEHVDVGTITNTGIANAQISDDGRYLTWSTTNDHHIYWHDRQTKATRWITQNHGGTNVRHAFPKITADGRYVAFASNSRTLITDTSLMPGLSLPGVYLYDSQNQTFRIISLTASGQQLSTIGRLAEAQAEFQGGSVQSYASFDITPDGKYVVYSTDFQTGHPDRLNKMYSGFPAILRREIATGATLLVNRNSSGVVANGIFRFPRISTDGNRVVFQGEAVGLSVPVITTPMVSTYPYNPNKDLYVKDLTNGAVYFLTPPNNGTPHSGNLGNNPQLSEDGKVVAFSSTASNLISGNDPSDGGDVFRADLSGTSSVALTLVTKAPDGSANVGFTSGPYLSGDGRYVSFSTNQFSRMGFAGSSTSPHGIGVGDLPNFGGGGNTTAFDIWAANLPQGMRGPNDNPSGDGVPNLMKFFIGSNADAPDLRHLPQLGTQAGIYGIPGDTNNHITLTVRVRRNLPDGYSWQVQYADTLNYFETQPSPTLRTSGPIADGEFDIYTYASFNPMGDTNPTGFLRLKVSLP